MFDDAPITFAASALCVGAGLGYLYARRRTPPPPSWGWGWFTEPTKFEPSQTSTIIIHGGKIPVKSKGPLLWLHVSPEELQQHPAFAADALVVPAGTGSAFAIAGESSGDAKAALDSLLAPHGDFKWVAPRDVLFLATQGRAGQAEVEAVVRAASLVAWHQAHRFAGSDGTPTLPPTASSNSKRRKHATTGRSLYPRVDPVAICLIESHDGERCLLGRQSKFPRGMFTCIAGFVELGESVERAAAREVLEETNVRCERATVVASQPWPCGRGASCELMLGVFATAARNGEAIDVGAHADSEGGGELESARWFDRAQVKLMLDRANGRLKGGANDEFVPPPLAIAYHLIERWCEGTIQAPPFARL